jgi:hypothetical protein
MNIPADGSFQFLQIHKRAHLPSLDTSDRRVVRSNRRLGPIVSFRPPYPGWALQQPSQIRERFVLSVRKLPIFQVLLTPIAHLALAITSRSLLSSDGKLEA